MSGRAEGAGLATKLADIARAGATEAGTRATEVHKQFVDLQGKILDTFTKVLDSDVGKAAAAEFMLPGAGAVVLGATKPKGTDAAPSSPKPTT